MVTCWCTGPTWHLSRCWPDGHRAVGGPAANRAGPGPWLRKLHIRHVLVVLVWTRRQCVGLRADLRHAAEHPDVCRLPGPWRGRLWPALVPSAVGHGSGPAERLPGRAVVGSSELRHDALSV